MLGEASSSFVGDGKVEIVRVGGCLVLSMLSSLCGVMLLKMDAASRDGEDEWRVSRKRVIMVLSKSSRVV